MRLVSAQHQARRTHGINLSVGKCRAYSWKLIIWFSPVVLRYIVYCRPLVRAEKNYSNNNNNCPATRPDFILALIHSCDRFCLRWISGRRSSRKSRSCPGDLWKAER